MHDVHAHGQVVTIARDLLGVPLVNIGGTDIVDGQHKLVLAILWQLMRAHMRRLLQACPGIPDPLDVSITSWPAHTHNLHSL